MTRGEALQRLEADWMRRYAVLTRNGAGHMADDLLGTIALVQAVLATAEAASLAEVVRVGGEGNTHA